VGYLDQIDAVWRIVDRESFRKLLIAGLIASCAGCGFAADPAGGERQRPNVVVFSLDTLRADHLKVNGYARRTSPNFDRLAQRGVNFQRAVAQSSSTLPSHLSLFQSRWASQTGDRYPMLAEVLKEAGYSTVGFTGGGNVSARFGFGRGFDSYYESKDPWGRVHELMPHLEEWLAESVQEPFFMFLHCYDIHHPYNPPDPYPDAFFSEYDGFVTPRGTGQLLNKIRRIHKFENFEGEIELNGDDRKKIEALYDSGILYTDTYIKRLDGLLEAAGVAGRTIVVLLSDHGEEFWEHGSVLHSATVYREVLDVPLVFSGPGIPAGNTVSTSVRLIDVAPTILELLGLQRPTSFQGQSLLSMIGGVERRGRPVLSEMHSAKAWLEWPWKLVIHGDSGEVEFFDLQSDELEQMDLSGSHPKMVAQLKRNLEAVVGPVAEFVPVAGFAEPSPEDARLKEQLQALGYVE
jgi:arylsulfatase A-like enzyme